MTERILVDGRPGATVAALDRGLQYGDGLFETIAVQSGRPRLLRLHFERLAEGCRRLGIPGPDPSLLEREIGEVARHESGAVKVIVTRGVAGRGYRAPQSPRPTRVVAWFGASPPDHPPRHEGLRLRTCRTRLGHNPALAGIKHLCRLEQVLARSEWRDESIAEGLMLDEDGEVVCGTQSNVFIFADGELLTPRVDRCGVAGVMRRAVLGWAADAGLRARECRLAPDALLHAEEVFLTNALLGAVPVGQLDGRDLRRGSRATEFMAWLDRR